MSDTHILAGSMSSTARPANADQFPAEIAAAIIVVASKVRQLGADEKNPHGGYAYVSVDRFYERIGPMMAEAGLALLIDEVEADVKANERTDERGNTKVTAWLYTRYALRFMHASGAVSPPLMRSCALPISGPQAFGSAQSYIEKQFLRAVFKIPTGEKDADATATDGEPPPRRSQMEVMSTPSRGRYQGPPAAPQDDAKDKARQLYREMKERLSTAASPDFLDIHVGPKPSPEWVAMCAAVQAADPVGSDNIIQGLRDVAEQHRRNLEERGF